MPRLQRIRRMIVCLVALVLLAVPRAAWAVDGAPDEAALGSITLNFNPKSGATVNGASITLYTVGVAKHEDTPYFDTSQGQFAGSSTVAGVPKMTSKELDDNNRTISRQLEKEVAKGKIAPYRTATVASNKATFADVPQGLYLVCQANVARKDQVIGAFLLSVPDREGSLDVTADPKPDTEPDGGESISKKTERDEDQSKTTRKTTNTRGGTSSSAVTRRLARTGDPTVQAWPLALVGFGVLLVGLAVRRSGRGKA